MSNPGPVSSYHWILPEKLMVGDRYIGADFKTLQRLKIRGIVVVRPSLPRHKKDYQRYQLNVMHLNLTDTRDTPIARYFSETNRFIHSHLKRNQAVLVHCSQGKSRSTTLIAAYLMYYANLNANQAMKMVKQLRPPTCINSGFQKQLQLYDNEKHLAKKNNNTKIKEQTK